MNDSLSAALKEAYALAPASVVIFHTLEIRQTGIQESVYLVQARRAIEATDENDNDLVFEPAGFQFSLPPSSEDGFKSLNIAIDNIDRRVSDFINTAKDADVTVEIIYRPFLSTDLTQPQMDPPLVLYLEDVQVTSFQVTGRATFKDLTNMKFPSELYTRDRFPGLG